MGIAKFDDGIPDGPKFIAAGPIACWLWFASVCYCRRTLTDGFIPKAKVSGLVVGLSSPYRHATRLVEVGLWDDAIGGYQVHDYLDWNPSKATIEDYRKRDKERKHKAFSDRLSDVDSRSDSIMDSRSDSERRGASRADAKSEKKKESEQASEDLRGVAPTNALIALFSELHMAKFQTKAVIRGGKDAKLLAELWKQRDRNIDEINELMRRFFESTDPFIRGAGYTVGVFVSQFGKLLTARAPRERPKVGSPEYYELAERLRAEAQ